MEMQLRNCLKMFEAVFFFEFDAIPGFSLPGSILARVPGDWRKNL
jgi:hypothetical protein